MAANKRAIVTFEKEFLTGLNAGKRIRGYVTCPSRKAAMLTKKEYAEAKVDSGEFSNDLFRYRNLRVVKITQALDL